MPTRRIYLALKYPEIGSILEKYVEDVFYLRNKDMYSGITAWADLSLFMQRNNVDVSSFFVKIDEKRYWRHDIAMNTIDKSTIINDMFDILCDILDSSIEL